MERGFFPTKHDCTQIHPSVYTNLRLTASLLTVFGNMLTLVQSELTPTSVHGVFLHDNGGIYVKDSSLPELGVKNFTATKEILLDDLGRFPLDNTTFNLLPNNIKDIAGNTLTMPEILHNSFIPIFYAQRKSAFITKEAKPICRFFAQSWGGEFLAEEQLQEILFGFAVISSFTGLYPTALYSGGEK